MPERLWCSFCGSHRHSYDYCPHRFEGYGNRMALRCSYCGGRDHNRDACEKAWPGPNPVRVLDGVRGCV